MQTANDVYSMFILLKRHFTVSSFDYNSSKKITRIKKIKEPAIHSICSRLSCRSKEDLFGLFLSNLIANPRLYFYDLLSEKSEEVKAFWQFRIEHKYEFFYYQLLRFLRNRHGLDPFKLVFAYYADEISLETLVALNRVYQLFSVDNSDCVVSSCSQIISKYSPFLQFDTSQLSTILSTISRKVTYDKPSTKIIS